MLRLVQRSRSNLLTGIGIHALNEFFEDRRLNTPLATTTNLDCRKFAGAYQGIGLRRRNIQCFGNVGKGQEARHGAIVPKGHDIHQRVVELCGRTRVKTTIRPFKKGRGVIR